MCLVTCLMHGGRFGHPLVGYLWRNEVNNPCQHILQPPPPGRRSLGLMAADRVSTWRDRTTNYIVDDSPCRLFGPARSWGLWRISIPVTRSSLRPTSSVGTGHGRTHGARPAHWTLPAIDQRNKSSNFHPSTIRQLTT